MTPHRPLLKPLRHPILCMKIFMSVSTFTGNQPIRQRSLFSNIKISLRIAHRLITSFPDIDHKMVTTPLAAIPFQLARLFILDPKRCGREPIIPIRRNHTMNKPPLTPQRNHDPPLRRNHMKLINRPNSHGHNRRRRLDHLRSARGASTQNPDHKQSNRPEYQPSPPQHHMTTTLKRPKVNSPQHWEPETQTNQHHLPESIQWCPEQQQPQQEQPSHQAQTPK